MAEISPVNVPESDCKPKKKYLETKKNYIKNRMENDAEFRQKMYDSSNMSHKKRINNDPEYKEKYLEYHRNYAKARREKLKMEAQNNSISVSV